MKYQSKNVNQIFRSIKMYSALESIATPTRGLKILFLAILLINRKHILRFSDYVFFSIFGFPFKPEVIPFTDHPIVLMNAKMRKWPFIRQGINNLHFVRGLLVNRLSSSNINNGECIKNGKYFNLSIKES
jgi:hypothetical protein